MLPPCCNDQGRRRLTVTVPTSGQRTMTHRRSRLRHIGQPIEGSCMDAASTGCFVAEAKDLGRHYRNIRNASLKLAESLSDADATVQSLPDASPAKWHLALPSWFFATLVLLPPLSGYRVFDERRWEERRVGKEGGSKF